VNDIASRAGDTAELVADGERPLPARADAWSLPGPRRKARREFRPRRRIPGVLVAAVLVAAGIAGCIWAASAALSRPLWNIPHSDLAGPLQSTVHWDDTGTLLVAAAVAFAGFLLVLIAVIPGRTRAIPLASGDDSLVIGVPRRSLRRSLGWLAADVAGIEGARVRIGRHVVKVRATTRLRDPAGLRESVQRVVEDRLARLDPLWPARVKVRLRRKEG
jgi:Family of unknown function (DUF6286)